MQGRLGRVTKFKTVKERNEALKIEIASKNDQVKILKDSWNKGDTDLGEQRAEMKKYTDELKKRKKLAKDASLKYQSSASTTALDQTNAQLDNNRNSLKTHQLNLKEAYSINELKR